jgi:hypothetical protein
VLDCVSVSGDLLIRCYAPGRDESLKRRFDEWIQKVSSLKPSDKDERVIPISAVDAQLDRGPHACIAIFSRIELRQ